MLKPTKVLFIGDVVGKLARKGIKKIIPKIRTEHDIDLVIANIENLAHGKGITIKTFQEICDIGIDAFTSGNHIWRRKEGFNLLKDKDNKILRPANYPLGSPGRGFCVLSIGQKKILLINLQGRVFMKPDLNDPFLVFDDIIASISEVQDVIVDFHAEASSEKLAFAHYVAGRASLVVGTHTHVPTADAGLLTKKKLGFVSDIGMVGAKNSILGVKKEEIIKGFLTQRPVQHKMLDKGKLQFNSILATINKFQTIQIKRVDLVK